MCAMCSVAGPTSRARCRTKPLAAYAVGHSVCHPHADNWPHVTPRNNIAVSPPTSFATQGAMIRTRHLRHACSSLAVLMTVSSYAVAQGRGGGGAPPSIEERTSGTRKLDGYFPLYWDE